MKDRFLINNSAQREIFGVIFSDKMTRTKCRHAVMCCDVTIVHFTKTRFCQFTDFELVFCLDHIRRGYTKDETGNFMAPIDLVKEKNVKAKNIFTTYQYWINSFAVISS